MQTVVGLLPVPVVVCRIRVGTECPPYGKRYVSGFRMTSLLAVTVGWAPRAQADATNR